MPQDGVHRQPVMSAGTARTGVPRVPVAASTAATSSGPAAKPALPPTENTLIACWLSPPAARAVRVPGPPRLMAADLTRPACLGEVADCLRIYDRLRSAGKSQAQIGRPAPWKTSRAVAACR